MSMFEFQLYERPHGFTIGDGEGDIVASFHSVAETHELMRTAAHAALERLKEGRCDAEG